MEKKITIHKKNEIVRGSDKYSIMGKRALNTIYWAYQKYPQSWKDNTAVMRFATMRKMMNLETDQRYVETIKEALLELLQPMELHNFTHPITNTHYKWFACSMLDEAGFRKNENGEWVVTVKISRITAYVMQLKGNFTPLELIPYTNSFRTKYAMKLYEYLKSFGAYSYLDITQKHMMKLFGIDEKSSYKYYGDLQRLLERQLKEIAKKSDLTEVRLIKSKVLSKEKKFRIKINNKTKKTVDEKEAKIAVEKLIKRF